MNRLKRASAVLTPVAVLVIAVYLIVHGTGGSSTIKLVEPDTPPGEYLYLDKDRVLAYLGQIFDGLSTKETRTLAQAQDLTASVTAGPASLGSGQHTSATSQTEVAPTVADRFYLLLRLLRGNESLKDNGEKRKWLFDIGTAPAKVYRDACKAREGDFVRIRNAHLFLPPYAAILPKTTYADLNRSPSPNVVPQPTAQILAPHTIAARTAVNAYQKLLGRFPRLPFVVTTLSPEVGRGQPAGVSFFIPARYEDLLNEPSLISGTLTIVGKVVYRNLTRVKGPGRKVECGHRVPTSVPDSYVDRQTLAIFLPALKKAPAFVLRNLHLDQASAVKVVAANIRVPAPVVVVVPIAMYQ